MSPLTEIWNVLHDGTIADIKGAVPRNAELLIDIPYLRKFFTPSGVSFRLLLKNCTLLRMYVHWENTTTESFTKIVGLNCDILSTQSLQCPAKVHTTQGDLELNYEAIELTLDSGEVITSDQLNQACEQYWTRWKGDTSSRQQ